MVNHVGAWALCLGLLLAVGEQAEAVADATREIAISKSCRDLLRKRMFETPGTPLVLGHFYVSQAGPVSQTVCAWHASSAYGAFTACTREAAKRNLTAACLPLVRDSIVVARSYAEARALAGPHAWELTMASDPLRCGQEPGSRFSWLEHGFCDMNVHGAETARGMVIWNHGIMGTLVQHAAPPALALRLLQTSGWDIVKISRHNLGESADSYRRGEERTSEEVKAQRARGYRRVVVAGQSFGGRVALELAASPDLFGAVAFAPGMETTSGNTRTQAPTDERLRRATVDRLAVIFPGGDDLFGNIVRGVTAGPVLAARGRPYLLLDEGAGLKGHGGGTGGNFALRYGRCLEDFLNAETVADTRFQCASGGGWAVARALLPAIPPQVRVTAGTDAIPGGLWYGILGESIIAFAVVDIGKPGLHVLFTFVTSASSRGGGVYEATLEGAALKVAFTNSTVLAVSRRDARTLTVTRTPPATASNFGISARRAESLQGELVPAE